MATRGIIPTAAVIGLLAVQPVPAEPVTGTDGMPPTIAEDQRQLVEMPPGARRLMQADMLDHLDALNRILGLLAENDLDAAAEVAEIRMGRSSMGKHRATGMGPGRFMPQAMRSIGWGMHDAATEFAEVAGQGDAQAAYRALGKVTGACVACHYSYRTQ